MQTKNVAAEEKNATNGETKTKTTKRHKTELLQTTRGRQPPNQIPSKDYMI